VNVAASHLPALQPVVARPIGHPQAPTAEPVESGGQVELGSVANEPRLLWQPSSSSLAAPAAKQLARVANASWQGTASQSLAEFASRHFSSNEFQAHNSGSYHNVDHPLVVAEATGGFAHGLGWSPQRKEFMQQVALLHDADDRSQVGSEVIKTGTPARARVTLEWMDQQQDSLKQRFGWNDDQLLEAKALIARTDFPFDDKARKPIGTRYDGQSPLQAYRDLLEQQPGDAGRLGPAVRRTGRLLRRFFRPGRGIGAGAGHRTEVGRGAHRPAGSLKFTPTFLAGVAKTSTTTASWLRNWECRPTCPTATPCCRPGNRDRASAQMFELMGQAIGSQSPEQVGQQLESLKESTRISYRLTTGQPPT